jgi:disulfide oxidoreductase YuzD
MVMTYGCNNKIYSVDMMFSYLNIYEHPIVKVKVEDFLPTLTYQGWGNPIKNIMYSANDVINNPTNKKYENDYKRIQDANLKYPIIIHNGYIVDGVHRLAKAYLTKRKTLNAYIFDKQLMNKFMVNKKRDYEKVKGMNTYEYIQMFNERFCAK